MWIFMSALTRWRTMHGSDASCLTMNMPQPSEKAIRAVRVRWIWIAIVAFPTVVSSEGDPFAGFVDQHLAGLGHQRNVVMSTQSYAMAPAIVAGTDLLCTLPRRMLLRFTQTLDIFPPPLDLPPIVIGMYWHPKTAGIRLTAGCENSFFRPPDVRYDRGYSSIFQHLRANNPVANQRQLALPESVKNIHKDDVLYAYRLR